MAILEAQCDLGFGGISEKNLQRLALGVLQVSMPERPDGEDDKSQPNPKVDLSIAVMKHFRPEWSVAEVNRALSKAFAADHPDLDATWSVDSELVLDFVTQGERKGINNYYSEVSSMRAQFNKHMKQRTASVAKFYKTPKEKNNIRCAAPCWLPQPSERTRAVTRFITKYLPTEARLQQDDYNGRWFGIYPDRAPKNISWTKGGYSSAAMKAIWAAWQVHREMTGAEPPWNTAEMDQEIQEGMRNECGEEWASARRPYGCWRSSAMPEPT